MDIKNYRDACPRFAESQRLDPAAGTLMNLATCEEKIDKLASAWQHWKESVDSLPAMDDRIPFARARVASLETRLPHLKINLSQGAGTGGKVFRDEIELEGPGQGVWLPVDSGPHLVIVRMPGHQDAQISIIIADGEEKQIDVHPGMADPVAETHNRSNLPRTLGWVAGGIGIAGIGTAVVTGVMLANAKNTVDANCIDKICTDQRGVDAASRGHDLVFVNTAAWIVGAAGIGLGAYFLISSSPDGKVAALVPLATPSGPGLSCVGTF